MSKKFLSKILRLAMTTGIVTSLFLAISIVTASAVTPPSITSAAYHVNSGTLVITGADLVTPSSGKGIDLSKIKITDGKNNIYTLASPKVNPDSSSTTTVTTTLSAVDAAALAQFLDKAGTTALNGGTYAIYAMSGWNGTTSKADFSGKPVTVSEVPTLSAAAYNYSNGELSWTATDLASVTGNTNDITPRFFTIVDSANNAFTLSASTKSVEVSTGKVTLSPADKLALEAIISKNGTSSDAGKPYGLLAAYGWNGKNALATATPVAITVTGWAAPTITFDADKTVTYGGTLAATAGLKSSKVGSIYVVSSSAISAVSTQDDLDALVASKDALKVSVTNPSNAVSVPTGPITGTTKKLNFTTASAVYYAIAVDKAGTLSAASTKTITINNVNAPSLTCSTAIGTTTGAIKVSTTATLPSGDTLAYKIDSSSITTPPIKYDSSLDSSIKALPSDGNVIGVSTNNKYLGVYELDSSKQVVKFKQFTVAATQILTTTAAVTFTQTSPSSIAVLATDATALTVSVTALPAAATVEKFTIGKAATQTITIVSGGDSSKVGTPTTSTTAPVYTVDTSALAAGGSYKFQIKVTQTGKGYLVYDVTITKSSN